MLAGMEHDQRFKALLRTFFAEFLLLFFAEWAARFDLTKIEWLDKELLAGDSESSPHLLDMVARVGVRHPVEGYHAEAETPWLVLVHIEIESADQTTRIKPRMPRYYHRLRAEHELPVLPIVIYLNVHLEGIGEDVYRERFWEFEVCTFRYLYVGLAGLEAVEYLHGDNWLGVALTALMRIPPDRVAWLGTEALRRLSQAPLSGQKRYLLAECVQAYLPLDETQRQVYDRILQSEPYAEVRAMNKTIFDEGLEKGQLLGAQRIAFALLEERFGGVSSALRKHLESLSLDELSSLTRRIYRAASLEEVGLGGLKD